LVLAALEGESVDGTVERWCGEILSLTEVS
jgi:hypothetical protein